MRKIENVCVQCGAACLGAACRYDRVTVGYCDDCNEEGIMCEMDGVDLCETCFNKRCNAQFDLLSERTKAEILQIDNIKWLD